MSLRKIIQEKLDNVLLSSGVLSFHIRRLQVNTATVKIAGRTITINKDEYVVFRTVSSKRTAYGDGVAKLSRSYIDINYYYAYEKDDSNHDAVVERVKRVVNEFLTDKRFRLVNDQSDIYDLDNPYRGINVELSFTGVINREQNNT